MTEFNLHDQLEHDIVELLLDKLEHAEITPERASVIAKFTLTALPDNLTNQQIRQLIPTLDDEYTELAQVVHKYLVDYETTTREQVMTQVHELLEQQQFDQAHQLMQDYLAKKL